MFKKQKNIILNMSHFIVFLLIQGLLVCPGFALNIDISSTENLSPRINISSSLFSELIQNSYSSALSEINDISDSNKINLLDVSYQKKYRLVLRQEIIDSFNSIFLANKDNQVETGKSESELDKEHFDQLDILKAFFSIAEVHYEEQQFESGEFHYNHALEVAAIAAKNKAGFVEILAALFHRMPTNKINSVIASLNEKIGRNKSELFRKNELVEIKSLIEKLLEIVNLKYYVHSQGANSIENFMGVLINKMEGDFRIMRLVLADKQASIAHASEIEKADIVEEIQDIYGPFAGRFGMFEIKKELENAVFKIHDPKGYELVMQKVRNTFGLEYNDLNGSLEKIKTLIQSIADQNQIEAKISSRVKSPYRIHVKEKISGKGKRHKDTLYGVDTIGIKVICANEDCFYRMTNEIRQALIGKKLGNWKIGKIKTIAAEITYINLEEIEGKGNLELQFLTKEADDLREVNFAHWSYEIVRQTASKQKFDEVENFEFYQLREEFQKAIDAPNRQDVNINTVIEEYFKNVYDQHKQWVYIFEKSNQLVDGKNIDVVKPKRLPNGANGPVFAAQTGIDLFDKNYDGIGFYEWRNSNLVMKRIQYDELKPLKNGDIISVIVLEDRLLNKIKENQTYKSKLLSSIRGFLRPMVLFTQINLSNENKARYEKNAQSFLDDSFKQKGIIWGESANSKFPLNAKYLQNFLNAFAMTKKLKNADELLMALALQLIDSSEVVAWAYEQGAAILKNSIQIEDPGIQQQIKSIYGSLDKLVIEVGIGKISMQKVLNNLKAQRNVNMSIRPTISGDNWGRFEYNIEVKEVNKKEITAKMRKVRAQIKEILKKQGIEMSEDSFNQKKSRKIKGGFIINFEIPVKYDQLPDIRMALRVGLETNKVKTIEAKKNRDNVLKTIKLKIKVNSKSDVITIILKSARIGSEAMKDYSFDEQKKELFCVIEYDDMVHDENSILDTLNILLENAMFVAADEVLVKNEFKEKQVQKRETFDLIESAI